jgi:hypothetical protein
VSDTDLERAGPIIAEYTQRDQADA